MSGDIKERWNVRRSSDQVVSVSLPDRRPELGQVVQNTLVHNPGVNIARKIVGVKL